MRRRLQSDPVDADGEKVDGTLADLAKEVKILDRSRVCSECGLQTRIAPGSSPSPPREERVGERRHFTPASCGAHRLNASRSHPRASPFHSSKPFTFRTAAIKCSI